jgi:hypothetical protein
MHTYKHIHQGGPDVYRGANLLLRDALAGVVVLSFVPPSDISSVQPTAPPTALPAFREDEEGEEDEGEGNSEDSDP